LEGKNLKSIDLDLNCRIRIGLNRFLPYLRCEFTSHINTFIKKSQAISVINHKCEKINLLSSVHFKGNTKPTLEFDENNHYKQLSDSKFLFL
jgi:hypothetical protein